MLPNQIRKKRVAINDIAKQLNISVTTVSFIINGKAKEKRISNELTKKVLDLVHKVGYVPNQLAKSLRTGKTNIIGLIVEDISNTFFANVARLIEEKADAKGYKIFYCSSDNEIDKTRELIKVFRERQVDGYIITPSIGIEEEVGELLQEHFPVILFDRRLGNLKTSYVGVDNQGGTYEGTRHLIRQGYRHIAFVTLNTKQPQMQERLSGYKSAMEDHGLKPIVQKVHYKDDKESIIKQIGNLLSGKKKLDAIFFATNYLGIDGLEAIGRLGLKIPSDIAVLSFDDHDLFRLYSPSITVVAQPIEEMSNKVIEILLDKLEVVKKEEQKREDFVLPTRLIIRGSTPLKAR